MSEDILLRDYQVAGLAEIRKLWNAGRRRVLVVAPTGAGKGEMISALIRDECRAGQRVACVSHRREIVDDLRERTGRHEAAFSTIQELLSRAVDPVDLLVLDEAHHYRASTWQECAARLGRQARVVGFTATPQRADGRAMGDAFDAIVDVVSYSRLIELGHIVKSRVYRPPEKLANSIALTPAEAYLRHARDTYAFCFVASVADAASVRDDFVSRGVPAEVVHSGTPLKQRKALVESLRDGALKVLVNVFTMTEGVNVPRVSTVILAKPCGHPSTYLQMVGRALRSFPGKSEAVLLDLAGCSYKHGLPGADRHYSLSGKEPIQLAVDFEREAAERRQLEVLNIDLVEVKREIVDRATILANRRGFSSEWVSKIAGGMNA